MRGLRLGERARHFAGRDRFEQVWLVPAWLGLGLASLAIALVAFRQIAPRLGSYCGLERPDVTTSIGQERRARQIARTVQLAARYAPWRADCYPQAIVARLLLGFYRLPYCLSLGLRRDAASGAMQAHAWVRSGSVCVTGGNGDEAYRTVGIFVSEGPG